MPLLLGNSFPLSLVRRRVVITPRSLDELRVCAEGSCAEGSEVFSFWGHENTLVVARDWLGWDVTPRSLRPAITLDAERFPSLDGHSFSEVWIVSPDYHPGFRPEIGVEVSAVQIHGWQILHMDFS